MKMIQRLGRQIPLLVMLTLVANVQGQSGPLADPGDLNRPPGGLAIPNDASVAVPQAGMAPTPADAAGGGESIGLGEILEPVPFGETNGYCLENVAPLESTGSWLRRGYWFVEQDVLLYNRQWDKPQRDMILAIGTDNFNFRNERRLSVEPARPGVFANMRLTLGRFMFRDDENRDHFTQFTYLGGGQAQQKETVFASSPFDLFTPIKITSGATAGRGYEAFDQSNEQSLSYTHQLDGLEYNYHIKKRMARDQMVLLPEGRWVRRATPTRTLEFLGGIRWLGLDEWFQWTADGINGVGKNGTMNINTDNNLLGFQLGTGLAQEFARFSIGVRGKAGVFVNFTDISRSFRVRNGVPATGDTPATNELLNGDDAVFEEETLAFIGETSLIGRFHIHQNFSLRLSGDLMFVNRLAIAPQQISFAPGRRKGFLSGHSLYLGFGAGIEGYW